MTGLPWRASALDDVDVHLLFDPNIGQGVLRGAIVIHVVELSSAGDLTGFAPVICPAID